MKIMYLNPIGLPEYNQTFADMAREYKEPDNTVTVTTLNASVGAMNNLEYRVFEALIVGDTIKAARQAAIEGYDAFVIGCFYDPALEDVRQLGARHGMITVAPCQASIETALRLGNKYSVIIGQWLWEDQMTETIRRYGYENQLASFRSIDMSVHEMSTNHEEVGKRILEQAKLAVEEDRAEVIVLGCTMEIGTYKEVQEQIGVPVIDPSIASLKSAEFAAKLKASCGWTTSTVWGMEPPAEQDLVDFGILQEPYEFSGRIDV